MKKHDDLFQETTMTFGEHLDELRISLFRAVVGLLIGVGIGLYFGDRVVQFIQHPLEKALATFYSNGAVGRYNAWAAARPSDAPLPYSEDEIKAIVFKERMLFDILYIDPLQALAEARYGHPELRDAASPQPASAAAAEKEAAEKNAAEVAPVTAGKDAGETDAAGPDAPKELLIPPDAIEMAKKLRNRLTPVFVFHPVDEDSRVRAKAMSITESFSIWLKAALVFGTVLASPWIFFQIWSFVAAGLYPHEKKYVYLFLPFSLGLFLLGAATAYLFVFEPVLNFLLGYNLDLNIDPEPRIGEWLGFVLLLPLGFGVSFQLPLVMLFLERIGIFSIKSYIEKWRIAVLAIFIISAVLTPADPYSILFMACPLTVLYFGGLLLCRYLPRAKRGPLDDAPGR